MDAIPPVPQIPQFRADPCEDFTGDAETDYKRLCEHCRKLHARSIEYVRQLNEWSVEARDAIQRNFEQAQVAFRVDVANHGLESGNAIYFDSTTMTWVKAQADDEATLADAVVLQVLPGAFTAVQRGRVRWPEHGLTVGSVYYLDPSTAGALTTTKPTTATQFAQPILRPLDADTVLVSIAVGQEI